MKDSVGIFDKNKLMKGFDKDKKNDIIPKKLSDLTESKHSQDLIQMMEMDNKSLYSSKSTINRFNNNNNNANILANILNIQNPSRTTNNALTMTKIPNELKDHEFYGSLFKKSYGEQFSFVLNEIFCHCKKTQRSLQEELEEIRDYLLSEESIIRCILDNEKFKKHILSRKDKLTLLTCVVEKKDLFESASDSSILNDSEIKDNRAKE